MAEFNSTKNKVSQILQGFISSKKIPHALLFTGIDGIGKSYTALNFAIALNSISSDPGKSQSIKAKIEQYSEPYIKYIFPLPRGKNETESTGPTEKFTADEIELLQSEIQQKIENPYYKIKMPGANTIKINSIRDIQKFISLDYSDLKYRVIIISDAQLMSEESQNALLKNLEEPPSNVIFILITAHPEKLRETIRSRCWRINFEPLSDSQLVEILKTYYHFDDEAAKQIVPFAQGSVETAIIYQNKNINELKSKIISVLRFSFGKKYNSAFQQIEELISEDAGLSLQIIITMVINWLNDLAKYQRHLTLDYYTEHEDTFIKFNQKFPDISLDNITNKIDLLSSMISKNINQKLLTANLVFELSSVTG